MAIVSQSSQTPVTQDAPVQTNYGAMAMVTTLFFMWGFLTCLNDILIPHLKTIFDLNYAGIMLVQFAFFGAYFVFSLPSAKIIDFLGYQRAMVIGLITMSVGTVLFVPAASVPSYPLFLAALIILAAGMTVLQTSANPYVAVLGPPEGASTRLNLTQAFNSFGTFIAPWVGKVLILGAVAGALTVEQLHKLSPEQLHAYRVEQASSVKAPYVGFAIALFVLAVIIGLFKLPKIAAAQAHGPVHGSIWKYRHLVLGAVGIFVYVGAEVSIGSFLVNYLNRPEIGNMALEVAAGMLIFYWGGAMVGRFLGSSLLNGVRAVSMGIVFLICCGVDALSYAVRNYTISDSHVVLKELLTAFQNGRPFFTLVAIVVLALTLVGFSRGGRVAVKTNQLLAICAIAAAVFVCISMLSFGHTAVWAILFVGLFNSIMFPSIFTLGIDGLGELTGDGSGLLVAAIVGGAIIPELQGIIADRIGIHHAFFLPVLCYIYIAYYGFKGSKHGHETLAA